MIKRTIWQPDTCQCRIMYEWDTETSEDERVHTPIALDNSECPDHQGVFNTVGEAFAVLLGENRTKNIVLSEIVEGRVAELASMVQTRIIDGDPVDELKPEIGYRWRLTGTGKNRVVEVQFAGVALTATQKQRLQQRCDTLFGPGKVVVR